jgi:hypothetical protein
LQNFQEYKKLVSNLVKICDLAQLFSEVNRELIEDDMKKKMKGKKTRRLKITEHFIKSTECLEEIYKILKFLKVISISEVSHKEGVDLPQDQQPVINPKDLRSIFNHFQDISDLDR